MIELTRSELKLLKLVCQDKTNLEMAEKMDLSLRTIEKIKSKLYTKTKTRSSLGLFKWALKNGLYALRK